MKMRPYLLLLTVIPVIMILLTAFRPAGEFTCDQCYPYKNLVFIEFRQEDYLNNKKTDSLLSELGLTRTADIQISYYPDVKKDEMSKMSLKDYNKLGFMLRHSCVIAAKKRGVLKSSGSKELAALRADKSVKYCGPVCKLMSSNLSYLPNSFEVKFKTGISDVAARKILSAEKLEAKSEYSYLYTVTSLPSEGKGICGIAEKLRKMPEVEKVHLAPVSFVVLNE
jgi:hypothetical protein